MNTLSIYNGLQGPVRGKVRKTVSGVGAGKPSSPHVSTPVPPLWPAIAFALPLVREIQSKAGEKEESKLPP